MSGPPRGNRSAQRMAGGGGSLAVTAALTAVGAVVGAAAVEHLQARAENRPSVVESAIRWLGEEVLGIDTEAMHAAGPSRGGQRGLSRAEISRLPTRTYGQPQDATNGTDEKEKCAVCQESFIAHDECLRLPCLHEYHVDCIEGFLQSHADPLCPICRTPVSDM